MARSLEHDLFDLTGKKAVVTGGNGGIGLGFARGLARQGADVMIWARNQDKNAAAVDELRQFGGEAFSRPVDVADEDQVARAMQETLELLGRVDCMIANAGVFARVPSIAELDSAMYHDVLSVNQHGVLWTLREGARHMVQRAQDGDPGGSMIICGSLASLLGVRGMLPYAAAKGALVSIMRTLACELGEHQIRVNLVAPGYINASGGPATNPAFEAAVHRTPAGRLGYAYDHEAIAAYLASDGASFHTGDVLVLDGGYSVNAL